MIRRIYVSAILRSVKINHFTKSQDPLCVMQTPLLAGVFKCS